MVKNDEVAYLLYFRSTEVVLFRKLGRNAVIELVEVTVNKV